jgi:hypothetical protein
VNTIRPRDVNQQQALGQNQSGPIWGAGTTRHRKHGGHRGSVTATMDRRHLLWGCLAAYSGPTQGISRPSGRRHALAVNADHKVIKNQAAFGGNAQAA